MNRLAIRIAALLLAAAGLVQGAPKVVRYKLAEKQLRYVFATTAPVLHLQSGEILETT